jgi:hypothetical protein
MILDSTNIIQTNTDCEECDKICYRITVCESDPLETYYTEDDFSAYVGKVIQFIIPETEAVVCAEVATYKCRDEEHTLFPYTVSDCFDTCIECYPPDPEPEPPFELNLRTVRPGYDTPACTPDYWDKVKCKFSEALYQYMASIRYGIEFCCDPDMQKWVIKHELLKLAAINDPDICNETCEESQTGCSAGDPVCLPNGFYNIDLTVTYPEDFTEGNVIVNGQSFPIESSPQVVTLQLLANGAPVDISLSFSEYDVTQEFPDLFTAPECEVVCRFATFVGPKAGADVTFTNCEGVTETITVSVLPLVGKCVVPETVQWTDLGSGIGTTAFLDNC